MDIREFVDDYVNKVVDDTIAEINEGMVEYLKAEGYKVTKEEEEEPHFKLPRVPYEIGFVDKEGNYERVGATYPTKDEVQRGISYSHIAYADDEEGNGFTTEPSTNKKFLGFYCDSKPEDSQIPEDYLWLPIKEEATKKGPTKLEPTLDESEPTILFAYADSPDGSVNFSREMGGRKYIGTIDFNSPNLIDNEIAPDPNDPQFYEWTRFM